MLILGVLNDLKYNQGVTFETIKNQKLYKHTLKKIEQDRAVPTSFKGQNLRLLVLIHTTVLILTREIPSRCV